MSENSLNIQPGSVIAGRYEIVETLGQGAMGDVYICRHKDLGDKLFVLKVLKPEIASNEETVQRFNNEVMAALDVSHPNVVRAYEFVKQGSFVAYTMEYVKGGDLADKMSDIGQFPIELAMDYLLQICEGVLALHKHGIVHRDIKPENILLTDDDVAKISDFGISVFDTQSRMTQTGAILGSTNYLAPEYIQHQVVNFKTDIYAIGIMAYEMITASDPFPGDNLYIKMQQRTQYDAYDPKMHRADCPDKLANWIMKAIAMQPNKRYQTCEEMIDDLESIMGNGAASAGDDIAISNNNPLGLDEEPAQSGSLDSMASFEMTDEDPGASSNELASEGGQRLSVSYNSELLDLSSRKSQPTDGLKFHTTAVGRKQKKKDYKPLLFVFVGLITVLGLVYFFYYKPMAEEKEMKRLNELALKNLKKQRASIPIKKFELPGSVEVTKQVHGAFVTSSMDFSKNKIKDINFSLIPPFDKNKVSEPQLRKFVLTNIIVKQSSSGSFIIIAKGDAHISHSDKVSIQKESVKFQGQISNKNQKLTVKFSIPEKLDTSLLESNYGAEQLEAQTEEKGKGKSKGKEEEIKYKVYAYGSFDVTKSDFPAEPAQP